MRRVLLSLFVAMQLLLPSFSYAFVFPEPIVVQQPVGYPDAVSLPSSGSSGGSGSIPVSGFPVGKVAGVVCPLGNCSATTVAMAPVGINLPVGWPSDPATGKPTPPSSAPQAPPASASTDCWATIHGIYGANSDAYVKLTSVGFAGYINGQPYYSCTVVSNNVTNTWYTTPGTSAAPSCPAGYTASGSSCNLSSPADVQKPAGTPCQVMTDGGSAHWDSSNPACASHGAGPYWTDTDGSQQSLSNGTFSVVSADGKSKTTVGPADSNVTPIHNWFTMTDSSGVPHTIETITNLDSGGSVIGQSYKVDGVPVTQSNYNDLLNGKDYPASPSSPSTASGTTTTSPGNSTQTKITCSDVNTCGVAQDTTLQNVGTKVDGIQTSFSDFVKNFTTVVQVPRLYTPSTDTAQSALSDFSSSIKNTALVSSVTGFFDVNLAGGACPTWTIPVVNVMGLSIGGIEIDQFCTPTAYKVYAIASIVVLVVCGFFAFRVAVDN